MANKRTKRSLLPNKNRRELAKRVWWWFATCFTVIGLIYLALVLLPAPIVEHNSATTMSISDDTHRVTARAIAAGIGDPVAELHTDAVSRYFFQDGTLVDLAGNADELGLMYTVAALKTIVLGHFSFETPTEVTERITTVLSSEGYDVQVVDQPDTEFAAGDVILILSDAFKVTPDAGFGILVRKTALRVDGPVPDLFDGVF